MSIVVFVGTSPLWMGSRDMDGFGCDENGCLSTAQVACLVKGIESCLFYSI